MDENKWNIGWKLALFDELLFLEELLWLFEKIVLLLGFMSSACLVLRCMLQIWLVAGYQ